MIPPPLQGKVNLGAVDCTVHTAVCGQYGVSGYPTIKVSPGLKAKGQSLQRACTAPPCAPPITAHRMLAPLRLPASHHHRALL